MFDTLERNARMPPVLVLLLVGLLVLYIGYLSLKLHIKQEVLHELEQVTTVVIPAKTETSDGPNYGLALALLLIFIVVLAALAR